MSEILILTPGAVAPLATVAALNRRCGTNFADDDADALDMIKRASWIITSYCGQKFTNDIVMETVRLDIQHGIVDPENIPKELILGGGRPVISINSVTDEYGHVVSGDDLKIYLYLKTATNECWRLPSGYLTEMAPFLGNIAPRWRFPVQFNMNIGYDFSDMVDPPIFDAVMSLCAGELGQIGSVSSTDVQMEELRNNARVQYFDRGVGGQNAMFLTDQMKSILQPYKASAMGGDAL